MVDALVTLAPVEGPEEAPLNATAIRWCGASFLSVHAYSSSLGIRFLTALLPFRCLLAC
jgi:hypothetical protein